ncbi:hypothetical protein [Haloferax massiliensis]|uniref:Uncharacterized protein n=1 Tax=Haloferax massiliensis TaxID=1476858 RepID=A0A0D6JVK6_9EURY|nr:hypothetical protein [Haloferax massiliensis]CQR52504.1 hypothetical protein BN996_03172 [Haloferax massiliensis]
MIDWFTSQYTNPLSVAIILGLRFLSYFLYSGLVAAARGIKSKFTMISFSFAILSIAITFSVIHPDGVSKDFALIDFLLHFSFPIIAGYAVSSNPSNTRWISFSILLASTFFFLTLLIVLYGSGP